MKTITFECEVITPMFLAGADGQTPELRAPSIKGAMRFWWRAVNGHLVKQNPDGSWDFSELKKKETEIFGGGGQKANRSKIEIIVTPKNLHYHFADFNDKYKVNVRDTSLRINILDYLAYGTYEYKRGEGNVYKKGRIKEKQKFQINVRFNENYIDLNEDIIRPLILMTRIGGLGAKTRNGFGKFYIADALIENNRIELAKINEILAEINNKLRPYTSLTDNAKVFHLVDSQKRSIKRDNPLDILYELGKIYKTAREHLESKSTYDKRIFLGSPLQVDKDNKSFLERHAKSYFLSVAKSKNSYKGYIYFLPYFFLDVYKSIDNIEDLRSKYFEVHREFNELLLSSGKLKEL